MVAVRHVAAALADDSRVPPRRGRADDSIFSPARAGPIISHTSGYRTVLNPIEIAANANPKIVAADLGICFPYVLLELGPT